MDSKEIQQIRIHAQRAIILLEVSAIASNVALIIKKRRINVDHIVYYEPSSEYPDRSVMRLIKGDDFYVHLPAVDIDDLLKKI